MLQSIAVYGGVMLFMFIFAMIASAKDQSSRVKRDRPTPFFTWDVIVILLAFALIFGIRYDVGTDHLNYLYAYRHISPERYEPIFKWITDTLRFSDIHFSIYFGLLAFLQLCFVLYSVKNEKYIYPFLILTLFMGQFFWHWMNGIRQDIAGCIYVLAVTFIVERKPLKFLLFTIIAIGFHYSSILLLPTYFILYKGKDLTPNKFIQLALLIIVGYLAITKFDVLAAIYPLISSAIDLLDYSQYDLDALERYGSITRQGMSLYTFIVLDALVILYSNKMKEYFTGKRFIIYYNLYYWGMLAQLFLVNNMVLARPVRFFRCFKLLMIAFFLYYLYRNSNSKINVIVFIFALMLLAILFAATIVNEPYKFYWDYLW
ncbi:MAG: EpsG family protein [Muribaculaceae bacterium]|nr:EpsG family protein [Muribaculaceae bacterium]